MEHQKALKDWESLHDDDEEKLAYLAKFDGDVEKAKWAFIREKTKTSSIGNITSIISLPTPILAVLSGQVYFWKLWLLSVLIPNIVFKLWLVSPNANNLQNLKIVVSLFFIYSLVATCLLIPAFLKLKKEKDKTWFFALIIIVFSVGNLALSIQPILALNIKTTSVNNQANKSLSTANSTNELQFANVNEKRCVEEIDSTLTNYFSYFRDGLDKFGDFSWEFSAIKSNGHQFYDSAFKSNWQEIIYVEVKLSGILYPFSQSFLKELESKGPFSWVNPSNELQGIGFREGNYKTHNIYYECITHDDGTRVVFQSSSEIKRNERISGGDFKAINDKNSFKRRFAWLFPAI